MKKILLTVIQLVVTVGLLVWVYHDPKKLSEMREALTHARLQWIAAGMLAYFVVEIAAALRWQILLSISIASLLASFVVSGFNLFHLLPHKFPGREKLIEIAAAYHLYARHWFATLIAFCASLVAHLATFLTFLCAAYALRADVVVTNFFAVMPIERTMSALPISFAGVGLREKVLQTMLHQVCGVNEGVAVLIGSLSFLIMVLCCLPGGIVYFFYQPSGVAKRVKLSEMQREVAAAGHEIPEPP